MKKLFRTNFTEGIDTTSIVTIPITMENKWETIKEQDSLGLTQVIFVNEMQTRLVDNVLKKGGILVDTELSMTTVEEKDESYEVPTPSLLMKLLGKKVDPSIEESHHKEYHERLLKRREKEESVQKRLRKMIPLFNSSEEKELNLDNELSFYAMFIRDKDMSIRKTIVELNGNRLEISGNGIFVTESEELEELVIESATHYFK